MWCFLTGCQLPLTRFLPSYVRIHSCSFVWALVQNVFLDLNLSRVQICNYVESVHLFRHSNYVINLIKLLLKWLFWWNKLLKVCRHFWQFDCPAHHCRRSNANMCVRWRPFPRQIHISYMIQTSGQKFLTWGAWPLGGGIITEGRWFPQSVHIQKMVIILIPTALRPRRPFENVNTLFFITSMEKLVSGLPIFVFSSFWLNFPRAEKQGFLFQAPVRTEHKRNSGRRWRCQITFRTLSRYPWARHWTLKRSHRALQQTAKSSRAQTYLHPYVHHALKTERIQA